MRGLRLGLAVLPLAVAMTAPAHAATVVIFTEPMSLNRYTVVYDTPGRDRVLMCMAPPAASDCTEVKVKRQI